MDINFAHPWVLVFSLLSLLPFFRSNVKPARYSSLSMIPADVLSTLFYILLKLLAAAVIFLLVTGLAEPYYQESTVERIGKGAQIVLLLDRSASMNENFAGRYFGGKATESKVAVARQMLTEFVQRRRDDLFGMISFSTSPIHVLPLTQDKTAILSAIQATRSRGRGVTNIAPGLSMALDYFADQPQTGSRVILLVSDGAARIEPETQDKLSRIFHQNKVILYWIYLRNKNSASLRQKPANANETTTPEYFLHQYFLSMNIPYRAFEAENPDALQNAIREIEKLENEPIIYQEKIPRQYLANLSYQLAMLLIIVLFCLHYLLRATAYHTSGFKPS